jgi:hypothetical protein
MEIDHSDQLGLSSAVGRRSVKKKAGQLVAAIESAISFHRAEIQRLEAALTAAVSLERDLVEKTDKRDTTKAVRVRATIKDRILAVVTPGRAGCSIQDILYEANELFPDYGPLHPPSIYDQLRQLRLAGRIEKQGDLWYACLPE